MPVLVHMTLLHLHLLSDSTGETLEMIAKAALAQFDDAEVIRHFWPMVRSLQHLDRIVEDLAANPGLVFPFLGKLPRFNLFISSHLRHGTPFATDICLLIRYFCFYARW